MEYGKNYTRNSNHSNAQTLDLEYGITLDQTGTYTFPAASYGYSGQTGPNVTITNVGGNATGELTVALSGADASAFALSETAIANIAVGDTEIFTVTPKTGLPAGTYTATVTVTVTVTVSGGNGVTASFDVSFTVNKAVQTGFAFATSGPVSQTYSPSFSYTNQAIGGQSSGAVSYAQTGGTVTVSVNPNTGEITGVTAVGTVTVKATRADDSNYGAATASYTLTIVKATGVFGTVAAIDTTYTPTLRLADLQLPSDYAWVAPATSLSAGDNQSFAATYIDPSGNYEAAIGSITVNVIQAEQGAIVITPPGTITYGDGTFPLPLSASGSGTGAITWSVPANDCIDLTSAGTVTVKGIGSVTVTATKAADANYSERSGTLEITVNPRDISRIAVTIVGPTTYTGSQLTPAFAVDDGVIVVTGADYTAAYDANLTVAGGGRITLTGRGNYTGTKTQLFTITKATPTAEILILDPDTTVYYTGDAQGIVLPTLTPSYTGLGAITVKYNGLESLPVYPGTYAITLDIAEGANYAAVTGLSLGTYTIFELPEPDIRRRVTLNVSPYFISDPSSGVFYVESMHNLEITLTPLITLPDGYAPQVTTNRRIIPDDRGVNVTLHDDGTYTIRIMRIQEETSITISASPPTANENIATVARAWSHGRNLYIAAGATHGRAYIYNISGILVKILPFVAGETTHTTLPAGIYLVTIEGRRYKVMIRD
jgi:hypothetical protein